MKGTKKIAKIMMQHDILLKNVIGEVTCLTFVGVVSKNPDDMKFEALYSEEVNS